MSALAVRTSSRDTNVGYIQTACEFEEVLSQHRKRLMMAGQREVTDSAAVHNCLGSHQLLSSFPAGTVGVGGRHRLGYQMI